MVTRGAAPPPLARGVGAILFRGAIILVGTYFDSEIHKSTIARQFQVIEGVQKTRGPFAAMELMADTMYDVPVTVQTEALPKLMAGDGTTPLYHQFSPVQVAAAWEQAALEGQGAGGEKPLLDKKRRDALSDGYWQDIDAKSVSQLLNN